MARSKKNSPPPAPGALSSTVFQDFLKTISNTKQRVADAQTDHAREFKKCESLGIHSEATKLIQKLNKMSEEKRTDFLHFFDMARPWMGWDEQLDLLEHADQQQGVTAGAHEQAEDEEDLGETGYAGDDEELVSEPASLVLSDDEREERDPMLEETAQAWAGADEQVIDEEALDQGGFTFTDGKAAGREGKTAEDNPHGAGNEAADLWERGRVVGARERDADAERLNIPDFLRRQPAERDSDSQVVEGDPQFADDDINIVNLFGETEEDEADPVVIATATTPGADAANVAAQ